MDKYDIGSMLDHDLTAEELEEAANALATLSRYARRKADAVRCRLSGHIASAEKHERICERIHSELPEAYRW